jgi:mannose-6-phosphate isomerase class I
MAEPALYRTHPVHECPSLRIATGYEALATAIADRLADPGAPRTVAIDGFSGVEWESCLGALRTALVSAGVTARWRTTEDCLLPAPAIDRLLAPILTDDPVFGRLGHVHLEELWDPAAAQRIRDEVATTSKPAIIAGPGASLLAPTGLQIYLEVPKDLGQQRAAQGVVRNVGATAPEALGAMYKRLYFVEWPMLNRIKRTLLPRLDLLVDASDTAVPRFVEGAAFRQALCEVSQRPFRVKPWFAPGPWGGQWMKERFGLPEDQPNYAWSFELIAPENSLLLGNGGQTLECAFDYLLWQETDAVLGTAVAARYGSYFPIRFDYLDTMDGTNLSCQVHPRLDYIRDEFGEPFTQDETYYVVTCKPGARVFLGLRDDADPVHFQTAARIARDQQVPFAIEDYVNSIPSSPGDLFLIPSGTVHCSGANNLVLEISATPYIYTFKIYDYLRSDLRGNLRHVHLDHAFTNLDPTRRATWVAEHALARPVGVRAGEDWAEYRLGGSARLFFAVHRLEFVTAIEDCTDGKFLVLNLVDGERCDVLVPGQEPVELRFAETIIIPASIGDYRICNTGDTPCKLVKAFVKG